MAAPVNLGTVVTSAASGTQVLTAAGNSNVGDKIVLECGWFSATATMLSATDSAGNIYTVDKQQANGSNRSAILSSDSTFAIVSGVTTITVTYSDTTATARQVGATANSGFLTGNDGSSGQGQTGLTGQSNPWSAPNVTPTTNGRILGVSKEGSVADEINTPGVGYSEIHDFGAGSGDALTSVYQDTIGGTAYGPNGTWSSGGSSIYASCAVAYPMTPGYVVSQRTLPQQHFGPF